MFFSFSKTFFTQKYRIILASSLAISCTLFHASTSLAKTSSTTNQSQKHIMQLLEDERPSCSLAKEDVEKFRNSDGFCCCFGFSSIWLYSKWLQFLHPEKIDAYDSDWFKRTLTDILGPWSNCDNIKKFSSLVVKFQDSWEGTFEKEFNQLDTGEKKIQKEYSIASLLTQAQLKQLLKEDIIHNHKLIFIHSHNHTTALFKDGKNYYYFNANYHEPETKTSSIDYVIQLIFHASGFDPTKPSPLALEIFSLDETTQSYPSPLEVLESISPALSSESDYANKKTGLHLAAKYNCLECVRYFSDKIIDVDIIDKNGWSPLTIAARYNHPEILQLLIQKGADVNRSDNAGWTALMFAAYNGHLENAELLIKKEADHTLTNRDGDTALSLAQSQGHLKIVQILQNLG